MRVSRLHLLAVVAAAGTLGLSTAIRAATIDTFTGATGSWDNSSPNWSDTGGGTTFTNGDSAIFDDSFTGTTAVVVQAAGVQPTTNAPQTVAVEFADTGVGATATNYTFTNATGSPGIADFNNGTTTVPTSVQIDSAYQGLVSFKGANTYSGGFTLSAGLPSGNGPTVSMGIASTGAAGAVLTGPLGTGTVTLNGGSLYSSVNSAGAGISIFNAVNVAGNTTTLGNNITNGDINFLGALTGTGTLTNMLAGNANGITTASTDTFGGDLSGFNGTFNYQNQGSSGLSLVAWRFGPAAGGTGYTVNASNASFVISSSTGTTGLRNVALSNGTANGTLEMGSLSGTGGGILEGPFNGSTLATSNYIVGYLNTNTTFSGYLSDTTSGNQGNYSLTKVGMGTLTLSGAGWSGTNSSQYTGGTTISAGNLQLTNTSHSATGSGPVALSGGTTATLSGTGFSTGALTVTNASQIAPGVNTSGNFGVAGTLTVGASTITSANLDFDLSGSSISIGGGTNDLLASTGTIALTGSEVFTFDALNGSLLTGTPYTLLTSTGTTSFVSGDITTWTTSFLNTGSNAYTASYNAGANATTVTFASVPEPASLSLLGIAALSILSRRRRPLIEA